MNGGPTVRRIHRERALAEGARHPHSRRRARARRRPSRSDPAAVAHFGDVDVRELLPIPLIAQRCPRDQEPARRSRFPLSVASVFGLLKYKTVIVLNRQVGVVMPKPCSSADVAVESSSFSGYLHVMGSVDSLLKRAVQLRLTSINQWAATSEGPDRYAELDCYAARPSAAVGDRIDGFVHEKLIPTLQQLDRQARHKAQGSPSPVPPPVSATLPDLEDRFAFVGDRWHEMVPFFGASSRHQQTMRIRDMALLGVRDESTKAAVARYDTLLRDELLTATSARHSGADGQCDLYRDERYAVIRTPRGRYFVCQFLAPYVVESMDRKLYYFDAAEIGIAITSTDVRKVVTPQAVQIMHSYRHMFVGFMGGGHYLCMPREGSYFDELHHLPLERSLLCHLESGRLTLCAGYQPVNAAVHPIQATGRRTISLGEAKKRHLPIYWYDRPRRALRSKVMSMFT